MDRPQYGIQMPQNPFIETNDQDGAEIHTLKEPTRAKKEVQTITLISDRLASEFISSDWLVIVRRIIYIQIHSKTLVPDSTIRFDFF